MMASLYQVTLEGEFMMFDHRARTYGTQTFRLRPSTPIGRRFFARGLSHDSSMQVRAWTFGCQDDRNRYTVLPAQIPKGVTSGCKKQEAPSNFPSSAAVLYRVNMNDKIGRAKGMEKEKI